MTSLGFSEYSADNSNNDNTRNGNGNGNGKLYNRRSGGGGSSSSSNRTLKIPRNTESGTERGLLQSPNGAITGITNENGNNSGVIQQAGKKIKQIKDYIENIHRKGGEDSDVEGDDDNILPAYPAQGMGVYATNISHSSVIPGVSSSAGGAAAAAAAANGNIGGGGSGVRKTTQMNSLNPGSSYSSTLLEGMESTSPYFEKLTGIPSAPKKDPFSVSSGGVGSGKTSTYASQYYEQFVPYAETLANQLAASGAPGGGGGGGGVSGTNAALIEKLNYIIHMLEEKKDEKTGHVIEELVLYCFLGVFIIFVIDTFTRAASGGGRGGGGMFGGGAGRGGSRAFTASSYGRYQR